MRSSSMSLLPRTTLHSDSERYVYTAILMTSKELAWPVHEVPGSYPLTWEIVEHPIILYVRKKPIMYKFS